jgi:hypothetical protein
MLPIHSPQLEIPMPSQTRRHTRNVRNQAAHLFAKANRLARKAERGLHPSMFTNGNLTATERDIATGVHGDWRRMVYLAARSVSDKGETAWFNTPECPVYEPTAPALHRARRREEREADQFNVSEAEADRFYSSNSDR